MDSEQPPSSRVLAHPGSTVANARGSLRDALGAVRNLAQLLHSRRVAPKALAGILPDVLEACAPMRASMHALLTAMSDKSVVLLPARVALESFYEPRITKLEASLQSAMERPLNAKSRLALEEIVDASAFDLDATRALLQLLEDALGELRVWLEPRELVRQAFAAPEAPRIDLLPSIPAVLVTRGAYELESNPRVAMFSIAVGVELVAATAREATPTVLVSSDGPADCTIHVVPRDNPVGERLSLERRRFVEPTMPCLHAAATLSGAEMHWDSTSAVFSLRYPLAGAARAG